MMLKKILVTSLMLLILSIHANAQHEDIGKILDQIKVSYDLNKLNDCRIKLRAIDFSSLKTKEEKEQYAEAYRQVALSMRNHRYSRPAYDIYLKYLSLRDTILKEEKSKLISETLKKHANLHTTVLDDISSSEKERKMLLSDKATLDGLKKNNFRYSVFFTIALLAIFIFILMRYNNKLKSARSLLYGNRNNIFEKRNEVTKGEMSFGVINRLKFINENITEDSANAFTLRESVDKELKTVKEAEQTLKNIKENISQIRQLSEISAKTIGTVLQKISRT